MPLTCQADGFRGALHLQTNVPTNDTLAPQPGPNLIHVDVIANDDVRLTQRRSGGKGECCSPPGPMPMRSMAPDTWSLALPETSYCGISQSRNGRRRDRVFPLGQQ